MKLVSFLVRMIFLAVATYDYLYKGKFLFNVVFFLGTMVFLYLGNKDKHFYFVDSGFMLLFSASELLTILGYPLVTDVIGLDKLFHLLAGVLIAYSSLLLWSKNKGAAIMFALVVGIGWELYEWSFGVMDTTKTITILDTIGDVIADVLGAALLVAYRSLAAFSSRSKPT